MIRTDDPDLLARIVEHTPYRETVTVVGGRRLIGYAHHVDSDQAPTRAQVERWSQVGVQPDEARELLYSDVACALADAHGLPWFRTAPDEVQRVVGEMMVALGRDGVIGFRRMRAALEVGDYMEAAREIRDSKWHRLDAPHRTEELARRLESCA